MFLNNIKTLYIQRPCQLHRLFGGFDMRIATVVLVHVKLLRPPCPSPAQNSRRNMYLSPIIRIRTILSAFNVPSR